MRPISYRLPFGEATLIPGGCLHWPIGEKDLLREWVDSVATARGGFTILMGDAFDNARTTFGKHIKSYMGDENSREALDDYVRKEVNDLAKELRPIAKMKRIIGAIQGNHFWPFMDGTTSDQYLCQLLGIPYLGYFGAVRLDFMKRSRSDEIDFSKTLVAHHSGGSSGGRTTSGDVAAAGRFELGWDADIYLVSHTHRRIAWKEEIMGLTKRGDPHVAQRTKVIARTGAFLKGFKEDNPSSNRMYIPSYAEKAAYRATNLGWVEIQMKFTHTNGLKHGTGSGTNVREQVRVSY